MAANFEKMPIEGLVAIISPGPAYQKNNIKIMKRLLKVKKSGVYVTLSSPHSSIVTKLRQENLDVEKLLFIDGTGRKCSDDLKKNHVMSIQGPEALTELSIVITEAAATGKFDFVFIDSIGTLQLYNNFETSSRFMRFLTNKLKLMGIVCVIVSVKESESEKLNQVLRQSAETVIEDC